MDILFDEEGRMWVERRVTERWRVYDLYDAEGRLIGELRTPQSGSQFAARPDATRFARRDHRVPTDGRRDAR